ncbi:hypothetical protein SELMODRAFT_179107 [Selaginella moellendorffii]|uniref:Uncharacterized protein n=1 Tax=Selaginella moellendorffii TaxID=88036 RepID=D8SEF2_SELML|nr:peroxisome biogenesis protein 19-2 isoform X1 [Selaginella moellendorffii]EFJ17197.1 hypothetical protein SELMODRAFT_179107 [Selaginella moellendorffii]|eukprot:XP_002981715.1 peroxisome biogenesis protein 19-2 isoform X1 [Selaginella moellendorffii]
MASVDDSLDSLLDSALGDFKPADAPSSRSPESQALGKGLPPLQVAKKRSSSSSSSSANPDVSSRDATLEKLAEKTKDTVHRIDPLPQAQEQEQELLEKMTKEFESYLGTEDLQSVMGTFMQQLLSKDVLYQPMLEIGERYPEWLSANKSKLSQEEFDRYSRQHDLIKQLCHVYETTPDNFNVIMELMQSMQSCGQPPAEMIEELAPGLQIFSPDNLASLPPGLANENANCCIM